MDPVIRYGRACARCGSPTAVRESEPVLCDDCRADETAFRRSAPGVPYR